MSEYNYQELKTRLENHELRSLSKSKRNFNGTRKLILNQLLSGEGYLSPLCLYNPNR